MRSILFGKAKEKGAAIMLALFTITFVIFLANEIAEQTIMEYLSSATEVKKVQAHHAAKACIRLNLLRIKGYQQATRALGEMVPNLSMLDMIWSFPVSWPPTLPKELSSFDSSTVKKTVSGSLLSHQFISEITAEGGKIDINDLGSPAQGLRNRTKTQILQRLQSRVLNGRDSFAERYANFNFEELINNIADWIDADQESLNGGGERAYYSEFQSEFIPPNQAFKTIEELHMVAGMTDEIYEILVNEVTLYGVKGVNVNQADRDVLLSLFSNYDVQVADEVVREILKRRSSIELGGPFKDEKEFVAFLGAYIDPDTFNDQEDKVPLFFGAELNFRINCLGVVGNMTKEIEVVVYDPDSIKARLQDALFRDAQEADGNQQCTGLEGDELYQCLCQGAGNEQAQQKCVNDKKSAAASQDQSNSKQQPLPSGPPRIIYQRVK